MADKTETIRRLNDRFRQSPQLHGRLMFTSGVNAKGPLFVARCLTAIRQFDDFDDGNDPHHEHDFIAIEIDGMKVFAKIDYYDKSMQAGSDDPADESKTLRVMTVMLDQEY